MDYLRFRQKQTLNQWENDELNILHLVRKKFEDFESDKQSALSDLTMLVSEVAGDVEDFLKRQYTMGFLGALYVLEAESELFYINDLKREIVLPSVERIEHSLNEIVGDKTFPERIEEIEAIVSLALVNDIEKRFNAIIRSDGHRMVLNGKLDALVDVNESTPVGVYKTWFGISDDDQRLTHGLLTGTTIPVNEYFKTINGMALKPGGFGVPEEDCNCRCWLVEETTDKKPQEVEEEEFSAWVNNFTTERENASYDQRIQDYRALNERADNLLSGVL